jgi:hypothetical protein
MATRFLSTESFVEEKQKETELTLYAQLESFDYLDEIKTYRDIVQLQASLGVSQHCRVRKETRVIDGEEDPSDPSYIYTVKVNGKRSKNLSIKTEYNFMVDQDFYQYFIDTAEERQIKKRYTFAVKNYEMKVETQGSIEPVILPSLNFEVDVFEKQNGYRSSWVKIDVELDKAFDYISREVNSIDNIHFEVKLGLLPIRLNSGFIEKEATAEQKKKLNDLWKYEFKDIINRRTF